MISTFLVEHAWAVPIVFVLLLAGCLLLGAVLLRSGDRGRRVTRWLAAAAVLAALLLTLSPGGAQPERTCTVQFAWPSLGGVETLANIALLLPVAFLATLLTRRPVLVAAAASAGSLLIETVQALVPAIGRACDTTDWEMNTIGAVAGALLAWSIIRVRAGLAATAQQRRG
ncbi:VanZ family protein [Jiangella muralis]|uniref:VanZ family protein n=1 Tax=Jiangella muralis TaxID=702383 RepID=UPI00069DE1DA|nr:VanZ family protein [Jiangella muralis]